MYHHINRINIISNTEELESWFKEIPVPAQLSNEFFTSRDFKLDIIKKSDILIINVDLDTNNLELLKSFKVESLIIILIAPNSKLLLMDSSNMSIFKDIWPFPLNKNSAKYYFSKMIKQIKFEADYKLNQKYLDAVIETLPDMVWFKSVDGTHLKVNDRFCEVVGKSKEDVKGQSHYYIWDITKEEYELGKQVCIETDDIVLEEKTTCLFNEEVKSKDGLIKLMTYKTPIFDNDEIIGTVGIARDITGVLNLKAEFEIVLEQLPFAILFYDNDNTILSVNKSFETYFAVIKDELVGKNYSDWIFSVFKDLKGNIDNDIFEGKTNINGKEMIIKVHQEPVLDVFGDITGYFCIYSDVTKEHRIFEQIKNSAITDYLTKLYNLRYLYENIDSLIKEKDYCLLYIDLDDFKEINDKYGHNTGDNALVAASKILNSVFEGNPIFRIGGDEFLVVITDCKNELEIKRSAKNFIDDLMEAKISNDSSLVLSASAGIAFSKEGSSGFSEILNLADAALYTAKSKGKGQYFIEYDL